MTSSYVLKIQHRSQAQHGVSIEYLTVREKFGSHPTEDEALARARQVLAASGKTATDVIQVDVEEASE